MQHYRILLMATVVWCACWPRLFAAQNALIVVGITGDSTTTSELTEAAQAIRDGLVQRGFPPQNVEVLEPSGADNKVITGDLILQSLKERQTLSGTDEFWLILLGFSGRNEDDAIAFQVSGPRLTATALKTALDSIPARQYVFVGTSDSGAFIPVLLGRNRAVLAATRDEGEIDLPRFPEAWAEALKEEPKAGWKEIAARAATLTEKAYADDNLAVGEHARLGDPETGQVLEAPFGADSTASATDQPEPGGQVPLLNASDIKVDIRKPNDEWERQPATTETKKLMALARAAPNPDGFSSLLLEQRLGYRVDEDRTAEDFVLRRIYIASEDGVARWANFLLPQDPPAVTTRLEAARIIQPDGTSTVLNPAKMPAGTDDSSGMEGALTMVFLPDTHAGCVIEIAYRTRHLLDASVPDFSEELPVQQDIPAIQTEVQLQVPPKMNLHFKLRNSDLKPEETLVDGMRVLSWKMANLPAFEPLPYDPPARDFMVALDISSLDSWDALVTWYRRLARGSDAQDATVKAKAEELAAGATERLDKIRKAYEFVSALRYVAIEFGINGIRPRTPAVVLQNRYGDCKDKANLLIALLADMGIEGRLSLLNRGSSTDVTFPSWQFNHAIAYVPKAPDAGQPDDLWLDTTDSTAPFPTLSPGDVGRAALVLDPDAARFVNVSVAGNDVTNIEETWTLRQANDALTGTMQKTWSGLAEYEVRSLVRGLFPRQRDFVLQTELAKQLPNADFTGLALPPADDFSVPMRLEARVSLPTDPRSLLPIGMDLNAYFAAPERNRPLLLNNGQKLRLVQTVNLACTSTKFADTISLSPFDQQAAGLHATILWKRAGSSSNWVRVAELTIDQPQIAQADYAPVRRMLRSWTEHLMSP
jgi:hypothetical protein